MDFGQRLFSNLWGGFDLDFDFIQFWFCQMMASCRSASLPQIETFLEEWDTKRARSILLHHTQLQLQPWLAMLQIQGSSSSRRDNLWLYCTILGCFLSFCLLSPGLVSCTVYSSGCINYVMQKYVDIEERWLWAMIHISATYQRWGLWEFFSVGYSWSSDGFECLNSFQTIKVCIFCFCLSLSFLGKKSHST